MIVVGHEFVLEIAQGNELPSFLVGLPPGQVLCPSFFFQALLSPGSTKPAESDKRIPLEASSPSQSEHRGFHANQTQSRNNALGLQALFLGGLLRGLRCQAPISQLHLGEWKKDPDSCFPPSPPATSSFEKKHITQQ